MKIIKKVYAKKNNRAYILLKNSYLSSAGQGENENAENSAKMSRAKETMAEFLKITNQIKLIKTRIQLKMNMKKNLAQKMKFYNFQISKNKSLKGFSLKELGEVSAKPSPVSKIVPGADTFERDKKNVIKLPFVALELFDKSSIHIHTHQSKGKFYFLWKIWFIRDERIYKNLYFKNGNRVV